MGLDREMRPKKFPASLIIMLIGLAVCVVGVIWWATTDIGKYLDLKDVSIVQPMNDIKNLNISVGIAEVEIKTGGDKIVIEGTCLQDGFYRFGTQGDTYYIEPYKNIEFSIFSINNTPFLIPEKYRPKVTVTIPDVLFDKIVFDQGVGSSEVVGLKTKEMEIDVGVGEATFSDMYIEDRFDVDVGVGKLKFAGDVKGAMDIDVGIGDADFYFDGYYNDYDIDCDKGIGDLDIDRGNTSVGGDAGIPIKIDLGIGDMDIRFK